MFGRCAECALSITVKSAPYGAESAIGLGSGIGAQKVDFDGMVPNTNCLFLRAFRCAACALETDEVQKP